jgi:hypothetical protein
MTKWRRLTILKELELEGLHGGGAWFAGHQGIVPTKTKPI